MRISGFDCITAVMTAHWSTWLTSNSINQRSTAMTDYLQFSINLHGFCHLSMALTKFLWLWWHLNWFWPHISHNSMAPTKDSWPWPSHHSVLWQTTMSFDQTIMSFDPNNCVLWPYSSILQPHSCILWPYNHVLWPHNCVFWQTIASFNGTTASFDGTTASFDGTTMSFNGTTTSFKGLLLCPNFDTFTTTM